MSESIKYRGYEIEIIQDLDPYNPLDDDGIGCFACFHPKYILGNMKEEFPTGQDLMDFLKREKPPICLPLYLYDHGGISIAVSTANMVDVQWDVSSVGVVYVTREKIIHEYGKKILTKAAIAKAKKYVLGEVETYDQYLRGDVYGYNIEELGEACWGYFGYDHDASDLMPQARAIIDYHVKEERDKHIAKLKTYIKNRVPLHIRLGLNGSLPAMV